MSETSAEVIRRYLQNVITDGKNTETRLQKFADETSESVTKQLFQRLALEAKTQHERLSARLAGLGASYSAIHGLLSQLLGLRLKAPPVGDEEGGQAIQNLMAAFTNEHGNAAIYDAIANISEAASDYDTAELTRLIRDEATESAEKVWQLLPLAASEAYRRSLKDKLENRP